MSISANELLLNTSEVGVGMHDVDGRVVSALDPLKRLIGLCGCGLISPLLALVVACVSDVGSGNKNVRSTSVSSHNEFSRDSKPELFDEALDTIGNTSFGVVHVLNPYRLVGGGAVDFFCGDVLFQYPPASQDD